MNNLVILPIIVPLLAALSMIFLRYQIKAQKIIAIASLLITFITALAMISVISTDGIQVLHLGGWEPPYGISLVADMLAALLVATSAIVAFACIYYAFFSVGKDREQHFIYPYVLFLLAGVNGSFLTGDIFNLFVCFEVMLIASYVLLSLGGEKKQLNETIKYIVINIISSSLFVVAIAYLYSVTGTLNLAHLSERVAEVGQGGLLTTISLLFLVVFSIKSALFLYFWLPGSYSAPPSAISALFAALLTKVGIYSIIRTFTLIFYHQPEVTHQVMMWMAVATMGFGALGAISHWGIRKILGYNVIISVGFILFGVAVFTSDSMSGAVYYLLHDMLAKALIFILGGAIIAISGTDRLKEITGLILFRPLLGWLFFISVLALAGIPPISGFVGKVMILKGGVSSGHYIVATVGLLTSLLVLYSLLKVFINSFWGESLLSKGEEKSASRGIYLPGILLAALLIGMGFGAEWVIGYIDQATAVLMNPQLYLDAVFHSHN